MKIIWFQVVRGVPARHSGARRKQLELRGDDDDSNTLYSEQTKLMQYTIQYPPGSDLIIPDSSSSLVFRPYCPSSRRSRPKKREGNQCRLSQRPWAIQSHQYLKQHQNECDSAGIALTWIAWLRRQRRWRRIRWRFVCHESKQRTSRKFPGR